MHSYTGKCFNNLRNRSRQEVFIVKQSLNILTIVIALSQYILV